MNKEKNRIVCYNKVLHAHRDALQTNNYGTVNK